MNQEDLDKLFEQARRESEQIPAEDMLNKLKEQAGMTQTGGISKLFILAAVAVIILVSGLGLWLKSGKQARKTDNSEHSYRFSEPSDSDHTRNKSFPSTEPHTVNKDSSDPASRLKRPHTDAPDRGAVLTQTISVGTAQALEHNPSSTDTAKKVKLLGQPDILLKLQQKPPQIFELDCSRDTVITAAAGSRFFIESESFCNSRGEALRKGRIVLEVKECYNAADFIRENLSTSAEGGLLETGGMFHMLARKGADTLQIRRGYEIGFRPAYKTPERMLLWYGERDSQSNINWKNDSLGKQASPVFVALRGKYGSVFNPYFYKNYKLSKETMRVLQDTGWEQHLTAEHGVLLGTRSCREETGPFFEACSAFTEEIAPALIGSGKMAAVSRMSDFTFYCMSKEQYAFGIHTGRLDSFRHYVSPDGNAFDLNMPVFFSRYMGWNNMDCINKYKRTVKPLVFQIPQNLRSNALLLLPEFKAVSRVSNNRLPEIRFDQIPNNTEAILLVSAWHDNQFYVCRQRFSTSDPDVNIKLEPVKDIDAYLEWIEQHSNVIHFSQQDKP